MPNPFVRGGIPRSVVASIADANGVLVIEAPNADDGVLTTDSTKNVYNPLTVIGAEAFSNEAATSAVRVDLFDSTTLAGCTAATRRTSIFVAAARYASHKTTEGEEHIFHKGVFALAYDAAGAIVAAVLRVSVTFVRHAFPVASGDPIEDALPESLAAMRMTATTSVRENPNADDGLLTTDSAKSVRAPTLITAWRAWATDAAGFLDLYDSATNDIAGLTPVGRIPLSAANVPNLSKPGQVLGPFHKGVAVGLNGTAVAYFTGNMKSVGA